MLDPAAHPGEPRTALADDTPLERVVRTLLAAELDALLAEREGLEQDRDPEPLHRARVALRRSRTWLRQFRRVLGDDHRDLARGIGRLARRSGPLRDLDLLLEWLASQAESLGEPGAGTLAALEHEARRVRERAHAAWHRRWSSARTHELLERWRTLVTTAHVDRVPTGAVVRERLAHRHSRVLRLGTRLRAGAPAADFHALRIECKKLRYLLDGFAGLFDEEAVTDALTALRRLQGALGNANDAEVQREWLVELGRALRRSADDGPEPWLTIGRLWERAEARRLRARERFLERFTAFRTGGASARLERLLQQGAG